MNHRRRIQGRWNRAGGLERHAGQKGKSEYDGTTIDPYDVPRAARRMIDNHGRSAAGEADRRPRNLVASGEPHAVQSWQRIAAAIRWIEGTVDVPPAALAMRERNGG